MNELARSTPTPAPPPSEVFGRYTLYPAIASGGMATVHPARLAGAEGFSRLVAAKRLHPQLTDDPDFVTMFHDEACIASRIHHPNVVPVLDIVMSGTELILVQEYVHGVPLSQLMRVAHGRDTPIPIDIAIAVLIGILSGLHAAHEVKDEMDRPLEIVHRDVSPANVIISVDGMPRLLDFGIAKARTSTHHTREGIFKGKLAYMAPEQLRMERVDRTLDVYAAGVLAWELLVNRRVHDGRHEIAFVTAVVNGEIPSVIGALAESREGLDDARWRALEALSPVIARAMAPARDERFATAAELLHALLACAAPATTIAVAEWVRTAGAEFLDVRQRALAATEESSRRTNVFVQSEPRVVQSLASSLASSLAPSHLPSHVPPHAVSGSYPVTRLPALVVRGRALLPWIGAASFTLGLLVVFLLRVQDHPSPSPSIAPALALAPAAAPALALAPAPALASAPASSSHPSSTPPTPTLAVLRPVHAPAAFVAPAPPRWAPPPPPRTTASPAQGQVDCNPPFFFEGTKKVFKPSCL